MEIDLYKGSLRSKRFMLHLLEVDQTNFYKILKRDRKMSVRTLLYSEKAGSKLFTSKSKKSATIQSTPLYNAYYLQQTIGNQAVGRLAQAKIEIGRPNDKFEQEADRIADKIMKIEEPRAQRLCSQCEDNLRRQSLEEQGNIQAKRVEVQTTEATPDLESRISAMWSSGHPLPAVQRSFMERRFGANFANVRVHTDSNAAQLSKELNAEAFTHGKDVYFGGGKYNPGTSTGNRLLAHELTHVVQQGGASLQRFPNHNTKSLQREDKIHVQPAETAFTLQRKLIDIKLPSGNKIQVDCEAPPPPAPGLPPVPCTKKDLKPATGKQKTDCEAALNAAKKDSGVKKIMGNLTKLKGCSIPTVDCKDCTGACKGAGGWHFPKAIYMCADTNPTQAAMIEYLKHELTHELQDCRKAPDVNCVDGMKLEIEAYKAGGRSFESAFRDAVWSACYSLRCNAGDIDDSLAAQMKVYYDSL
jgi:hypothetical protein